MKQVRPLGEQTIRFALFLVRITPRALGYRLAELAGRLYGMVQHDYRSVCESNLEAVLGTSDPRRLRAVALQAFATSARAYYELLYMPSITPEKIRALVQLEEPGWTDFQEAHRQGQGLVVAAPHLSSFDVAGQALITCGFNLFVLALPDMAAGFVIMNKMRDFQRRGIIQPTGPVALRHALRVLHDGGVVVTGGDRPIRGQGTVVEFFGRPTLLPDGHIRLALHTGAPLFMTPCRREKGKYRVAFQRIPLERTGDDEADIRAGVQRFAQAMEGPIRAHPEQWHLLIRLWGE
jgi:KDO2-lipid IV(A) lauroyltransferase